MGRRRQRRQAARGQRRRADALRERLTRLENAVAVVLRHCEAVLPDGYRESGVWRICNEALGQTKGGAQ